MFDNAGTKIRIFAKVSFWILLVGTVILAITSGIEVEYDRYGEAEYSFDFVTFLTVAACGVFVSYVEAIFLSAFGELVENSTVIRKHLTGFSDNFDKSKFPKLHTETSTIHSSASTIKASPLNGEKTAKTLVNTALSYRAPEKALEYIVSQIGNLSADENLKLKSLGAYIANKTTEGLREELEKLSNQL